MMYTVETIESLHDYADRLRRDRARAGIRPTARSGAVRHLVQRVRRSG